MSALLKDHEDDIQELTLIPSDGGRYEVMVDDQLIFSKLQTGRHTDPGEILKLFEQQI